MEYYVWLLTLTALAIFQQVMPTKDSESCLVTKVIQFSN